MIQSLGVLVILGAITGWLSTNLFSRYDFKEVVSLPLGVVGVALGSFIAPLLGFQMTTATLFGYFEYALAGAFCTVPLLGLLILGTERFGWNVGVTLHEDESPAVLPPPASGQAGPVNPPTNKVP